MTVLTFKYRLLPSKQQHAVLMQILEDQRQLYNAALEERIDCYRKTGRMPTYIDQAKSITQCRRDIPEMKRTPLNIQRGTLERLNRAFMGFISRRKAGGNPGLPRFRSVNQFKSFDFSEFVGIRFDGKRLRFKSMPSGLRVHLHRPLPNTKILMARFKPDPKGWSVYFVVRIAPAEKREIKSAVGIDMGIKSLVATSDGLVIPAPMAAKRAERALRRLQRVVSRRQKLSNRTKKSRKDVARLYVKVVNIRSNCLHQISAALAKKYDMIVVEDLKIRGLAMGSLSSYINDASWGKLRDMLRYKAERAGAHFVEVDPKFTSQDCANCGARVPKTLKDRWHCCPTCGIRENRDVNAARVILSRAGMGPGALKPNDYAVAAPGNINLEGILN